MKDLKATMSGLIVALAILVCFPPKIIAAELRKVTFGYSSIGPMMHGLWMAKEIGAFERQGLETELIFIASGPVAYTEGVAALKSDKNSGLKVVAKYSRYTDPKFVESQYSDSSSFLDRVPRIEKAAVAPILEFMDQKDVPLETFADNSIIERLVKEGYIDKLYPKN
jgi:hypothetical protein